MAVKAVASPPCLLCQDSSSTLDSLRVWDGVTPGACIVLSEGTGSGEAGVKDSMRRRRDGGGQREGSFIV